MVKITVELLRKRSEHHEGTLDTLEEIALHQFKIRKIETINQICPKLLILLLQNNKIRKIENMNRLKGLRYLNLAINRITRIENLESLESLVKFDLTVNYVYDYRDFRCMSGLTRFQELHLLGNPCESQPYCKQYIIIQLQNLIKYNNEEITRADRIEASQVIKQNRDEIHAFKFYTLNPDWDTQSDNSDYEENDANTRIQRAAYETTAHEAAKHLTDKKREKGKQNQEGQIMQWNDTGFKYYFEEIAASQELLFKIELPQYLSSENLKVEVETDWLYIQVKEKSLQLRLSKRVFMDRVRVVRVTSTGFLKVYMPVFEEDKIVQTSTQQVKQQITEVKEDNSARMIEMEKEYRQQKQNHQEEDIPDDLPDLM